MSLSPPRFQIGTLLPAQRRYLIVAPRGREEETLQRLARVGYDDNIVGLLDGGMDAWLATGRPSESFNRLRWSESTAADLASSGALLVDVRRPEEYNCAANGHAAGAVNWPLHDLARTAAGASAADKARRVVVYCAGGYRSMIAWSIMTRAGFTDLVDVHSGYNGMRPALHAAAKASVAPCGSSSSSSCVKNVTA